jgi:uncharacterized delta-60 repeat protein
VGGVGKFWFRFLKRNIMHIKKFLLIPLIACVTISMALGNSGDLDTTFNPAGAGGVQPGTVITSFAINEDDLARAIVLRLNGKIIAAGSTNTILNTGDFAVAQYNTDGSLDTSFNGTGKVTTSFSATADEARAVTLQTDGNIVAAGLASLSPELFALARYKTDGSLDTSFNPGGLLPPGTAGLITTIFPSPPTYTQSYIQGVVVQPDGKIVAVGTTDDGPSPLKFALARYNPDGSLDTSFNPGGALPPGIAGLITTTFGGIDSAQAVALQSDGKIIAVGTTIVAGVSSFALARYNVDGSPDTSFGGTGQVTTSFGGNDDEAWAVALQSDGKIIAAGFTSSSVFGPASFALARYNVDGSLDTSFGVAGQVITSFGGNDDEARAVIVYPTGQIIAAGFTDKTAFALAAYNSDGSLINSFGSMGRVTTSFGGTDDQVQGLALQSDGKIVAAGFTNASGHYNFALARYNVTFPNPTPPVVNSAQSALAQAIKMKYCAS